MSANISKLTGNNNITARGGSNTINTGAGHDFIEAWGGYNTIYAGGGNNTVYAHGGSNWIDAGGGNNTVRADGGNNRINTGAGHDFIEAKGGNNTIDAGAGDDLILGLGAGSTIAGGSGDDIIIVCGAMNTAEGGQGSDYLCAGGWGMVDLFMKDAAGDIRTDLQSAFNATGAGGFGFTGSDVMQAMGAASGGSTLSGGWGNDFLMSGFGDDVLRGGAGGDTYVFHLGEGKDLIQDASGSNVIELRGSGMFSDLHLDASNIAAARTADGDLILNFTSGGSSYGQITIDDFALTAFTLKMVDGGSSVNVDLQALYNGASVGATAPPAATDIGARLDKFANLLEQSLDQAGFDTVHAPGVSTETYTTASNAALQHSTDTPAPTGA